MQAGRSAAAPPVIKFQSDHRGGYRSKAQNVCFGFAFIFGIQLLTAKP